MYVEQNQAEAKSALVSSSGFRDLPPTKTFVDQLLDDLFSSNREDSFDVLAPFNYESFLRREGLSC